MHYQFTIKNLSIMTTINYYNGKPISVFNTLVLSKEVFDTYVRVQVENKVAESPFVFVNPVPYTYGIDGEKYSAMDRFFYEWNKALLDMDLSHDQMNRLNGISNTRLNYSHRVGYRDCQEHEVKTSHPVS